MNQALRHFGRVAVCAMLLVALAATTTSATAQSDPAHSAVPQSATPQNDASQNTAAPSDPAPPPLQTPPPPADYSAAALYNAANAAARQGRSGLAVLDYERARLIDPSDADVDTNLRVVRQAAGLPPATFTLLDRLAALASPRWFFALGMLGVIWVGLGLLARFAYPRRRLARFALVLAGVLSTGVTGLQAVALWPTLHGAVVLTRDTPVRVSPVPLGDPLFALPEAETVTLRAVHDEFLLVETRAGRTGWVSRANVEPIVPVR